ncbi:MAG: hypothetical protein ACUVV5_11680 [Candidatus Aminicenantales bacterium]
MFRQTKPLRVCQRIDSFYECHQLGTGAKLGPEIACLSSFVLPFLDGAGEAETF